MTLFDHFLFPGKILVFITLAFAWGYLPKNEKVDTNLWRVLWVYALTEFSMPFFTFYGLKSGWLNNLSVLLQGLLWIDLLSKVTHRPSKMWLFIVIAFSSCLFLIADGLYHFNYYPFVLISTIYVVLFIFDCFENLRNENIAFFFADRFVLIFAPVLFFLGMSFMFAFNSKEITSTTVLGIKVYYLLNVIVNGIFYGLICLYIHRQNKQPL